MKRYLLAVPIGLIAVLIAAGYMLGLTPAFVIYGPSVGAGIGSKLLCSAEYVMGHSRDQAFDDLVQYSPILAQLTINYDPERQAVTTSLFGLSETTATYIPGLGCAVDYAGFDQRQSIAVQPDERSTRSWPAGSSVESIDVDLQSLLDDIVAEDNAQGLNTRALLLVHRGEIVAEAYAQQTTATTPLLGWSMAKSLMSVMLGNLEMRGLLALDSEPGFVQWQDDARADIRISDLLTMTDGLGFSEEYNPGDDATTMLFTSPSMAQYALSRPLLNEPGSQFSYSSGTANILSQLYLQTLGTPQQAYADYKRHIYQSMAMQNAVFEVDASGMFVGSSYFYASARDWARMGLLMLNDGVLNGQRIVSQDWVRRAISPNSSENNKAYGYQWWLNAGNDSLRMPDLPAGMYYANGNRQQYVAVVPEYDAVIVRLGWTQGRYPANDNFARIVEQLPGSD